MFKGFNCNLFNPEWFHIYLSIFLIIQAGIRFVPSYDLHMAVILIIDNFVFTGY